jgi:hypothetical protein
MKEPNEDILKKKEYKRRAWKCGGFAKEKISLD